ncbi:hypothetical protein DM02DRAFT_619197 [Periconia macrospinosa]|uniref:Uncharacterized protein n=1 Tax=Periconia macrospinosa TaxID=97972 RepID=A0A2V1D6C4_9PLEO|nr:hypothetical protein DM02DRAFT_619197 [Periconia macrospinosa]
METELEIKVKQAYLEQEYYQKEQARAQGCSGDGYYPMTPAQSQEWNQTRSALLKLPGELRNNIYAYVFDVYRLSIVMQRYSHRIDDWSPYGQFKDGYALAKTCRRTYDECIALFYNRCIFTISSRGVPLGLARFVWDVDRKLLASIRTLRIPQREVDEFLKQGQLSERFPRLKRFTVLMMNVVAGVNLSYEEADETVGGNIGTFGKIINTIDLLEEDIKKSFKIHELEIILESGYGVVGRRTPDGRTKVFGTPVLLERLL